LVYWRLWGVRPVCSPPLEGTTIEDGSREIALLSAMVNSSDDAIVGKTTDGVIATWNEGAEAMYGYRAEEIVGRPMAVLCPLDRVGEIQEILERIRRGERVSHFETMRRRKDGTTFPASLTVSPAYDGAGVMVGASSIGRDITESRRRTDELDQANQNLEAFTYSVSHDLRAPLRAMTGFSAALQEEYRDVLGEAGRGYAERIQAAGDQMACLIDDLLHLSQALRAGIRPQPVDLGAEVAQIAGDLQRGEPGRSVRFVIQRPVEIMADRTLIRTVLENLVGNAWKFTARRQDALIEFGAVLDAGAAVCCFVRDSGAGFDPAYADKLFAPFERLHTAGEFPGTGVGLASVRQIVERHGGRVWAQGAVGEGATFFFTLDTREMP
jgi:PAS domain S-box-containing protein